MPCQAKLMRAGKPYPKTCELCGLFGPCRFGLDQKAIAAQIVEDNKNGKRDQPFHTRPPVSE
jgi:hypothetical protein